MRVFAHGGAARRAIWHNADPSASQSLPHWIRFSLILTRGAQPSRRVFLCIFRDQASGSSLWSPQLNLEPSCFRNSPRNSTACLDFLKHYLGREVEGGGGWVGGKERFFYSQLHLIAAATTTTRHLSGVTGRLRDAAQQQQQRRRCGHKPVVGALYFLLGRKKREATRLHGW